MGFSPPQAAGLEPWRLGAPGLSQKSWRPTDLGLPGGKSGHMSDQTACRKSYKYKLNPTPVQEWELERVLRHCRALYNAALEQRITAWQRGHVSLTRFQQEAE
jgi:hypothetical protein